MTLNKSQGESINAIKVNLIDPVFLYDQFDVGFLYIENSLVFSYYRPDCKITSG